MAKMDLLSRIRNIPDFPKPGIQFKDITTLLRDGEAFHYVLDLLEERYKNSGLTHVVGIESRGFVFAAALADRLGIGMIPVRKQGKLPGDTIKRTYSLEYGEATIEVHRDHLKKGDRVVVLDDLLATGGTMKAACELVQELGADIEEIWVLIELGFLSGRDLLKDCKLHSEIVIEG